MRKDMSKVVTERPRRGHANKSKKTGRKLGQEEFEKDDVGSARAPVSRFRQYGGDAKQFSDLISPLRRSLRKNVGRPWNRVKSELSKTLDRRSMSGRHIWQHIGWEVAEICFVGEDGKVYDRGGAWRSSRLASGLFVHPVNGLLCWKPRKRSPRPPTPVESIVLDEANKLGLVNGIWYHYGTVYTTHIVMRIDPKTLEEVPTEEVRVRHLPKRQLNKKELAKHGLSNSPSDGARG